MGMSMAVVPIDAIQPGMTLAADVRDRHGRFLLGRNMVLDEGHVRIFRIWGVPDVVIEDGDGPPLRKESTVALPPEIRRKAEQVVNRKMGRPDPREHPARAELRRIFVQRAAQLIHAEDPQAGDPDGDDVLDDEILGQAPPVRMDLRQVFNRDMELASLPKIFIQVLEAINNPRSSAVHMSEVISRDQSLSAKLLKIANSPFYGFPGRIETISRAVTIIGTRQLSMLALGTAVITRFQDIPDDLMNMESFWKQSIACGIAARFLGSAKYLTNTETFFVAGLMHSLGQLVMLKFFPVQACYAMAQAQKSGISLARVEKSLYGFDHAWLGGSVMRRWKLPRRLEQAVRYQSAPLRSQYPMETAMVHIAAILARGMALGTRFVPPLPDLDCEAWDQLHFTPGILSATLNLMVSQVDAVYRLLFETGGNTT